MLEPAIRHRVLVAPGLVWLVAGSTLSAQDGGLPTREQALAALFPGAEIAAERVFLTDAQRTSIEEISRVDLDTGLIARYVATQGGRVIGRAYIDTHVVRTKRESLLISLADDGTLKRIDVTAFFEPRMYIASDRWLGQAVGHPLNDDLAMHRLIRPIVGATLTTHAATDATRRVMAIDQVLAETDQ